MSIDVDVRGVFVDHATETAVVLLGEHLNAGRVLPIAIGMAEAQAIAVGIAEMAVPRPLTHDLLLRAVDVARGYVRRVDVVGLASGTFLGTLELVVSDRVVRLDARPSDCIALAVRAGVPIGVDQELFDRASVDVRQPTRDHLDDEEIDAIMSDFTEFLEHAEPSDFRRPNHGFTDRDDAVE